MRSFIGRREHVLGLGGCATMSNRVGSADFAPVRAGEIIE